MALRFSAMISRRCDVSRTSGSDSNGRPLGVHTAAAVWTPSGRPFESLPLVRDTSHLREIMAENRSAIYGGAARDYKYALRDTRF